MPIEVVTVPCLSDNYAYLLRDTATGEVALIDAPESAAIESALAERGWKLGAILITHHHGDHVDGVDALRRAYGAKVVGAAADAARLPPLDVEVRPGDTVAVGESTAQVLDVPGHTVGHIAYYFPESGALFSADSLMVMGCGRLFEGSAEQMWNTLSKLAALPDETEIYSGHEYANGNLQFALSVDGDNPALQARAKDIEAALAAGRPTVPARLDLERATNPFLRAMTTDMKAKLGMASAGDAETFAELRQRKDNF